MLKLWQFLKNASRFLDTLLIERGSFCSLPLNLNRLVWHSVAM